MKALRAIPWRTWDGEKHAKEDASPEEGHHAARHAKRLRRVIGSDRLAWQRCRWEELPLMNPAPGKCCSSPSSSSSSSSSALHERNTCPKSSQDRRPGATYNWSSWCTPLIFSFFSIKPPVCSWRWFDLASTESSDEKQCEGVKRRRPGLPCVWKTLSSRLTSSISQTNNTHPSMLIKSPRHSSQIRWTVAGNGWPKSFIQISDDLPKWFLGIWISCV